MTCNIQNHLLHYAGFCACLRAKDSYYLQLRMKSYPECLNDMDGKGKPATWDCLMNTVISSAN